jgi:hypothetical protein
MYHGVEMATVLRVREAEVNARLRQLKLDRKTLLSVIHACTSEYGFCSDDDPPSARGYEVFRWGTRRFRELVIVGKSGWEKDDTANLSSIRNDGIRTKIIVLNTDDRTGCLIPELGPRNRLKKGILHERAIGTGIGWLPNLPKPFRDLQHDVWYLCIHINGEAVLSELSRPAAIVNGFIDSWQERLVFLGPDEWARVLPQLPSDDLDADFDPKVVRK